MNLLNLYRYADAKNITVDCFDLEHIECMSMIFNDEYFITINPFSLASHSDELVKLAHEIGHCETGCLYDANTPLWVRQKYECAADKWAIKKLIPKDELETAFEEGYTEVWELAEYFDVTEDFVRKAAKEYGYLQ